MSFIDKKISVKDAIAILVKSGIEVDAAEATVILDFLYLLAKNHKKDKVEEIPTTLRRSRTSEKIRQSGP